MEHRGDLYQSTNWNENFWLFQVEWNGIHNYIQSKSFLCICPSNLSLSCGSVQVICSKIFYSSTIVRLMDCCIQNIFECDEKCIKE